MVALAESHQCGKDMIARGVAVVKGLVAEVVRKGIDAEGGLLDHEDAQNAAVDVSAHPVIPAETADEGRKHQAHAEDDGDVVLVLPHDDWVLVKIGDVGAAEALGVLLDDHPAKVRVQQALADAVGVLGGVGVSVMGAVVAAPPADRAFDGGGADQGQKDLERAGGGVALVGPQAMVAGGDAEAADEVVDEGEDGSLEVQRRPPGGDEADEGKTHDEEDVDPVDVLVPVCYRHGRLGDVRLAVVVGLVLVLGVGLDRGQGGRSPRRVHRGEWRGGLSRVLRAIGRHQQ